MTDIEEMPLENNNSEEINSEDTGLGLYDAFDDDIQEPGSGLMGDHKSGKSGRKFMILVGILGAFIIIVLIVLVLYGGMIQPQQTMSHTQVAAEVHAQNTVTSILATSISMTETAIADKALIQTSEASPISATTDEMVEIEPKEMPKSTASVVPTKTALPAVTENNSSIKSQVEDRSTAHTATVAALLTLSASGGKNQSAMTEIGPVVKSEAMTSTAEAEETSDVIATSLPATGVIDDIGLVSLIGGAVILLGVIILARRLRKE